MKRLVALLLFITFISPPQFTAVSGQDDAAVRRSLSAEEIEKKLEGEFGASDIAATSSWIHSTGIVDWLGPLAPLALSPFFGVACLSGLAIWGPDWVTENALLGSSGPLKNQTLFVVFLVLTLLTSLPRLTKVSKPFAQAVDRLETYAVIVILLVIKVVASLESPVESQVAMVQLGIFSFTIDSLLAIAMIVNVLVINSVKFFFEFMVWLKPFPLVDAIFEVCNKTLCAALMAVYAFSPTLATLINLIILLAAAVVLRWISRRVRFYRTMVLDPILAKLWTGFGEPKRPELVVFPSAAIGPFAPRSRLRLTRAADGTGGWQLVEANWWRPAKQHVLADHLKLKVRHGWVMHKVLVDDANGNQSAFCFSRRYDNESLVALLKQLEIEVDEAKSHAKDPASIEFA